MAHVTRLSHEHRRPDNDNHIERTSQADDHYLPYTNLSIDLVCGTV